MLNVFFFEITYCWRTQKSHVFRKLYSQNFMCGNNKRPDTQTGCGFIRRLKQASVGFCRRNLLSQYHPKSSRFSCIINIPNIWRSTPAAGSKTEISLCVFIFLISDLTFATKKLIIFTHTFPGWSGGISYYDWCGGCVVRVPVKFTEFITHPKKSGRVQICA